MRFASSIVALTLISLVAASPYSVPASQSTPVGGSQPHTSNGLSAPSSVPSAGSVHGHGQSYTVSGAPVPSWFSGHPGNNGTSTGVSGSHNWAQATSSVHGSGSAGSPAQTGGSHSPSGGPSNQTTHTSTTPTSAPTHA